MLRHVRTIVRYLQLATEIGDMEESLSKIYNISSIEMKNKKGDYCPTRWLGSAFLSKIGGKFDKDEMYRACQTRYGWEAGVDDLWYTIDGMREFTDNNDHGGAIRWLIDNCLKQWIVYEEGEADADTDIGKLADIEAVWYIAKRFRTAEDFLKRVDESLAAAEASKSKDWGEYLVLSTVHKLKGMERPFMFGIGLCEGDRRSLLPHTFSKMPRVADTPLGITSQSRMEDERCIAYVMITRAKEQVYLSGYRFAGSADEEMVPSRFVKELGLI